jgi:hypothetical protein
MKEVRNKDTAKNDSIYITSLLIYILGVFNTFGFFQYAIFDIVLLYPPLHRIRKALTKRKGLMP